MDQWYECDQLSELLSAYADGDVTPTEHNLIRTHTEQCPSCAEYVGFIQCSKSLFAEPSHIHVPVDLKYSILAATINQPVKVSFWDKHFAPARVQAFSFAGAAALLLVIISSSRFMPNSSNPFIHKGTKAPGTMASAVSANVSDQPNFSSNYWQDNKPETSKFADDTVVGSNDGSESSRPQSPSMNNQVQSAALVERTSPILPMQISSRSSEPVSLVSRPDSSSTVSRVAPRQVSEDKSFEPHGTMEVVNKPIVAPPHTENITPARPIESSVHHVEAVASMPQTEGHTILTASASPTDSMDSLASLRTTLRKDEAIAAGEQLRLVPNKVLWDVYKSRF